jgi:pyrroloquinoline quinone biosynthesis protein D
VTEIVLTKPRLATGVRLRWDGVRKQHVLLFPEGAANLNATAADVLTLCDGEKTLDDIATELSERYGGADVRADVESLLSSMAARGLVTDADG